MATSTTNKNDAKGRTYSAQAVGRRKSSVARVYIAEGTGEITVNRRTLSDFFGKATDRHVVCQPLALLEVADKYDILINVQGGGNTGQSGAARLGISRALVKLDSNLSGSLRKAGFLTRDSRKVERKKAGIRGARRKFQFSKR